MTRRTRTCAALLALAAAATLAACGGDDAAAPTVDTEQQRQELQEAAEAARNDVSELTESLRGARSTEEAAAVLDGAADQLRERADQVESTEVEGDLQAPRDRLAAALRTLADETEQAHRAVEEGNWQEALRLAAGSEGLREFDAALEELRAAGVDVEPVDTSAAPGLGSGDAAELESAARSARDDVDRALADLAEARSAGDVADRMEAAAERVRDAAGEVEAAEARSDLRPAQEQLADALRALADELEAAAPDVRDGNVAEALRRAQGLASLEEVQRAIAELRARGVDVPDLTVS